MECFQARGERTEGSNKSRGRRESKKRSRRGIMMKRRGMRGSKGKVTRRRRRGGTSGTRGVGALYGVCKDHPSLPLLHSVVPDLERTRVLGGGGAVMVRATVYLQSMS